MVYIEKEQFPKLVTTVQPCRTMRSWHLCVPPHPGLMSDRHHSSLTAYFPTRPVSQPSSYYRCCPVLCKWEPLRAHKIVPDLRHACCQLLGKKGSPQDMGVGREKVPGVWTRLL